MRAHLIENGVIVNTPVEVDSMDHPGLTLVDATAHPGNIGDGWDGSNVVPHFDGDAYAALCEQAIEDMMNSVAFAHGYKDIERCITYIGDPVAHWNNEGTYAKSWRSACWSASLTLQAQVKAGNWPTTGAGQIPTVAQVLAAMPAPSWPTA